MFVRWDADFNSNRCLAGWNAKTENVFNEKRDKPIESEVLIKKGVEFYKFKIEKTKLRDELRSQSSPFFNQQQPTVCFRGMFKRADSHYNNVTVGFYYGGSSEDNAKYPTL